MIGKWIFELIEWAAGEETPEPRAPRRRARPRKHVASERPGHLVLVVNRPRS